MTFTAGTRVLTGTPTAAQTAVSYTYKVRDRNGDEATDIFTIAVAADGSPSLTETSDQSWIKGIAVSLTLPTATSGNEPLTYTLTGSLPTGVNYNTSTRVVSGTPSAVKSTTTYTYKVRDKDGDEDSDTFTITVADDTEPSLTETSDQSWIKGLAVSLTLPASSSGNTPLTYTLTGSLPTGVSFNTSTRVVSGTPSAAKSTTTYTYKVRDKDGDEDSDTFTITVADDTEPSQTETSDQSWVTGVAVSLTLPASSSGNTPLTYTLTGSLPTGVSYNTSTRVVSGTPSAVKSTTTYTYKVRDKDGDEDSDTFTIEVTNATPTLSDVAAQSWVKGIAKTVTLPEASGGDSTR